MIAYRDQINAQSLEFVEEISLGWVREGGFPYQCKSGVSSFCACFHYMFADVTRASDYQNLAFLRHRREYTAHSSLSLSLDSFFPKPLWSFTLLCLALSNPFIYQQASVLYFKLRQHPSVAKLVSFWKQLYLI